MMPDKRRDHILGSFSVPVSAKWLASLVVIGLINFGAGMSQFAEMKTKIDEVKVIAQSAATAAAEARAKAAADAQLLFIKDAHQDSELSRLGTDMAEVKARLGRR